MNRSGASVSRACEKSGPAATSTGVARSRRIHSSAAAAGSAAPLTSTRCTGISSGSPSRTARGPSGVSRKRRAKVSASRTVRRSAVSKTAVSRGPWISTYSPVL